MIKCPKCGSENVKTERRPNGNHQCTECHHVWPNETKKEFNKKGNRMFNNNGEHMSAKEIFLIHGPGRIVDCTAEEYAEYEELKAAIDPERTINGWVKIVHQTAVEKGWHEKTPSIPELIALMHSELSEALEEFRNGKGMFYIGENGKTEGIATELADCVIRIMDFCGHFEIDLDHIIKTKNDYNKTRSHRHGGKKI